MLYMLKITILDAIQQKSGRLENIRYIWKKNNTSCHILCPPIFLCSQLV